MLIDNIKLNRITSGTNLKVFDIDVGGTNYTYFGDCEATNSLNDDQENNKYCAYNLFNDHIIHNLYRSDTVDIQSAIHVLRINNNIEDYIRIFIPDFNANLIIKTCLNESFTYILTKPTNDGFKFDYYVEDDNGQFSVKLSSDDIHTHLYCPLSSGYTTLSGMIGDGSVCLSVMLNSAFNIKNICYNYIIEIPNELIYNFYDDGIILGDGLNTKNHLGYDYKMHLKSNINDSSYGISVNYNLILFDNILKSKSFSICKNNTTNEFDVETEYGIYTTNDFSTYSLILTFIDDYYNIAKYYDINSNKYININVSHDYLINNIVSINSLCYATSHKNNQKFVLSSNSISSEFNVANSLSSVANIFIADDLVFIQDTRLDENSNIYVSLLTPSINITKYKTWPMVKVNNFTIDSYNVRITYVNDIIFAIFDNSIFLYDAETNEFNRILLETNDSVTVTDICYILQLNCYFIYGKGYVANDNTNSDNVQYFNYVRFSFNLKTWNNIDYDFLTTLKYCYYSEDDKCVHFINDDLTIFSISKLNITKWNAGQDNAVTILFSKNRNYIDINKRGDTMYLKYITPVKYNISEIEYDNNIIAINKTLADYCQYDNNNLVKNIIAHRIDDDISYIDNYQKVEVIQSINRFKQIQHKSNMYSIQIDDAGINTQISASYRLLIKDDIENNIRNIIKTIAPANTQFLNIKWTGK